MADVTADYLALRREAGARVVPRDVLRVRGADAVTFLQGQLSADVAALAEGDHCWSLLLEPQGKVDAWLRVWRTGPEELVLDVDGGWGERTSARLHRFKLRVDATIDPLDWGCVSLRGPGVADLPQGADAAGRFGPAELVGAVDWRGLPGLDALGPSVRVPDGVAEVGPEAWTSVRVEQGWPEMGRELDDTVIPAEAGQWLIDCSVSFTKGCYTGQELVARIDSRGGNTPRRLRGVVLGANVLPPEGAVVVAGDPAGGAADPTGDTASGSLTSVGESLDLRAPVALALVHRSVEPGAAVTVRWPGGEAPAVVRDLPLL